MTRQIPLSKGYAAIVDDVDYARVVTVGPWRADVRPSGVVYAKRHVVRDGVATVERLHRMLCPDWERVDHINGDGLDNRRANLRPASRSANGGNRGAQRNNTSGFKGVTFHKHSQRWRAQIAARGRKYHLGLFSSPSEAAAAYDAAAIEHFGEFARLNFPGRKPA